MLHRNRVAELVYRTIELLAPHPGGVQLGALLEQLQAYAGPATLGLAPAEVASVGTTAAIKAGWVSERGGLLMLTGKGAEAYQGAGDAQHLLLALPRPSLKAHVVVSAPLLYVAARKAKYQLNVEYKMVRRMASSSLSRGAGAGAGLRHALGSNRQSRLKLASELPVQSPRAIDLPEQTLAVLESLYARAGSPRESEARDGSFARLNEAPALPGRGLFFAPRDLAANGLRHVVQGYPASAGLYLPDLHAGAAGPESTPGNGLGRRGAQREGGLELTGGRKLASGERGGNRTVWATGKGLLVANALFASGAGPRVYDLLHLRMQDRLISAYVMDEPVGRGESESVPHEGGLKELCRRGVLVQAARGRSRQAEPAGSSQSGDFAGEERFGGYSLGSKYRDFLEGTVLDGSERSHWGDRSIFRGWRYAYQTVPGLALAGKRSTRERMEALEGLMKGAGVTVRDKLVLDVGCNIGVMMSQYLRLGARWCHGWDRPEVTAHTERVLLALGCTRFSVTGRSLNGNADLESDVPAFLRGGIDGCAISYLAVRGPLGWLESLGQIPWSFMIYEGHEDESAEDFEVHMAEMARLVKFEVAATADRRDGDSDARRIAILIRRKALESR